MKDEDERIDAALAAFLGPNYLPHGTPIGKTGYRRLMRAAILAFMTHKPAYILVEATESQPQAETNGHG